VEEEEGVRSARRIHERGFWPAAARARRGRAARLCVSKGEGGREVGRWAVQQGGAQLVVGREATTGGPGQGK
jgi:hypothetical protein